MPENKQITTYTIITREACFPEAPKTRLEWIDEINGKTKEQELLEYCQTPRFGRELYAWFGLKATAYVMKTFIKPLVENGRLLMTLPNFPTSNNQRYVTAGYEPIIANDENILKYCKIPRRKKEIAAHFKFNEFALKQHINPLIADGRLKGFDPYNQKNHWQKYVDVNSENAKSADEEILNFCTEPRTRKEISDYMSLHIKYIHTYIRPLVAAGKLKMTRPEAPISPKQKYVIVEKELPTLTETQVVEFCKIPKRRKEVAEHFGLPQYTANNYLNNLVDKGSLKFTIPLSPEAKQQGYVSPDSGVIILSEKNLLEYCKIPRTRLEIKEYFGFSSTMAMAHLMSPLIKSGKINYTIPKIAQHKKQKYITAK